MKIANITSQEQLSSFGNSSIEITLLFEDNTTSRLCVPAGISAGKYEAKCIPVPEALAQIEQVKSTLINRDFTQETLDAELMRLGLAGNVSIGISAAFCKKTMITPHKTYEKFPKLLLLLFEGGKHGSGSISIQEFHLIEDSLVQAISDFKKMRSYLTSLKIETTVGAEGGFCPATFTDEKALATMNEVFPNYVFGIDAAGSFKENENQKYTSLLTNYNIFYLEDLYSDEDWENWIKIFEKYNDTRLIVGDDLTVTNPQRIIEAIEKKAINAVIIKPNQNGTITGTLEAVKVARENNLKVIVSHRGEETNDSWIVDFALSIEADYVKFGGINRGERIAKYNRLLELGMK